MANSESALLGTTAAYTAWGRALESKRIDPLFIDPFAASFAGDVGRDFMQAISEAVGLSEAMLASAVAVRTKFFDDALLRALSGQIYREMCSHDIHIPKQVVILAAGGDARSVRLAEKIPKNVRFFEIDLHEVMRKRSTVFGLNHDSVMKMKSFSHCYRQI